MAVTWVVTQLSKRSAADRHVGGYKCYTQSSVRVGTLMHVLSMAEM